LNEVVVTGVGVVTPVGIGAGEFWSGLMEGRSGAGPITTFEASGHAVRIAAEVTEFEPTRFMEARDVARSDRFVQMALAAAKLARSEAGFTVDDFDPRRVGAVVGSGIGGLATIEEEHGALLASGPRRVSPFMVPRLMPNGAAAAIAMKLGISGVNFAVSSACATGAHAVGEAYRLIRHGAADVMFAGGSEAALTPLSLAAFTRMGAVSQRNDEPKRASRPFDAERDGFVFGEGAGILVLESKDVARRRGVRALAEVAGYGATCDAFHVTQPDPEGRGATRAIDAALAEARVSPADVDYVNAHGTSTPYNDRVETIALKTSLGPEAKRVAISSTKSQTGHLLGAAGAVEAGVAALAIAKQAVPGTMNLENPDPDCDLDYCADGPRELKVDVVLSNSFGFGGQNACLVFKRAA